MRYVIITVMMSLLVSASGCASSGEKEPDYLGAQVAAHNKTASDGEKIICKYVKETGSFIKKRQCRTVNQIKEEREEAQRTMGQIMSGGTNSSSGEN